MTGPLALGRAEHGELDAGVPLATLSCGRRGAPPVLLVPGYTGSKEDFAPLLTPLADAGMRAVAVDLPGQFESPGLPTAADYTVEHLGRIVLAACVALGPNVRLVGHSFGGLVSRAAVIADAGVVESLVLLSSGPSAIGGARRKLMELGEPILTKSGVAGLYAALQSITPPDPAITPELAAFLERRWLAGDAGMLQGMGTALRGEPDRVAELAATGVRTLVVHGADDDAWLPDAQRDMAERLGARYEVVTGAAHSAAVENPTALLRLLLDFWNVFVG